MHPEAGQVLIPIAIVVHPAEGGGLWAEVPSLPGGYADGEDLDELRRNATEIIASYLARRAGVRQGRLREAAAAVATLIERREATDADEQDHVLRCIPAGLEHADELGVVTPLPGRVRATRDAFLKLHGIGSMPEIFGRLLSRGEQP
jgi:predicted RNase H-like HicB family nuclease